MTIKRLNHAVLYVRDAKRSVAFYTDVLGFRVRMAMGDQAFFLSTGDLHEALAGVDVRSLRVVGGHTPLWVFTRPSALLESPWEAFWRSGAPALAPISP